MAKILIWPDLYKEHGHWLPCVNLANSLRARNHSVEFMGIPDCRSIVSPYGATFRTVLEKVYPLGHSIENKLEPKDQRWKPAHLLPLCRGEQGFDALLAEGSPTRPDLVVCGYFNALEALLLHYKYKLRVVIITTYLRHPDDDPAMHAKTKLIYMPRAFSRELLRLVGQGERTFEQFIHPLEGKYPELIPCPKEFDFVDEDWIHGENVVYVEPMITRQALGPVPPDAPTPPDVPNASQLIFATSGSQVQDYESKAREFFRNLILMMQTEGMGSYYLLAAVGTKLKKELEATFSGGENPLPPNVELVEWASQLEILGSHQTKAVFMHGGLATIKEAISRTVPIIIVPHGKDQLDNALRLDRLGLGVVVQQDGLSPLNLRKVLTAATANTWMKSNLARMKAIFDAQDNAAPAAKPSVVEIEKVLAAPL